jgi:RNA polymerase sigma-70 factor, ECF subfamily
MNATKNEPDAEVATRAAALMGRYCDGEAAAFHELYRSLAPRILGYLTGLCADHATAEDLLQLTFLKLHQARSVYVRDANPIPWIYTIAHRTCLDELRRRRRAKVRLAREPDALPEIRAHVTGIAEAAMTALTEGPEIAASLAMGALATLPHNQRDALLLTKVHGRSLAEAAAITGTTIGAVKLRIHRGYTTLRKVLRGRTEMEVGHE